ncbi:hypothetical protein PR048_020927 [Dryococelus australis]|uniref:Uncharacterized protein n=1 Tax=Dryococelus australis TaxID=614101 RepID=A0ABQ9GWS9_9NEOP|nr:hypothetical protein PR048_020927 [Dryococelus australis]
MTKCVKSLHVVLSSEGKDVHVQCWSRKLNLIQNIWPQTLHDFVTKTKTAFLNARKRKHKYLCFLKGRYPNEEKRHVLFPSPILTRWSSCFDSVEYCQATFLVEHGCSLVQLTKIIPKFTLSHAMAHTITGKRSDLLTTFELSLPAVRQGLVRTQFQSCAMKCHTKLTKLVAENPSKIVFKNLGSLFKPREVILNAVCHDLVRISLQAT